MKGAAGVGEVVRILRRRVVVAGWMIAVAEVDEEAASQRRKNLEEVQAVDPKAVMGIVAGTWRIS